MIFTQQLRRTQHILCLGTGRIQYGSARSIIIGGVIVLGHHRPVRQNHVLIKQPGQLLQICFFCLYQRIKNLRHRSEYNDHNPCHTDHLLVHCHEQRRKTGHILSGRSAGQYN